MGQRNFTPNKDLLPCFWLFLLLHLMCFSTASPSHAPPSAFILTTDLSFSYFFLLPCMIHSVFSYHLLSCFFLLIQLCSPCVFRLVSSLRPSYIPEMPLTYGPHSSRSAERPTAPHCRPCRDQPKAVRATATLQLKKNLNADLVEFNFYLHEARSY